MKLFFSLATLLVLFAISFAHSSDFTTKIKNDFPPLSKFKDIEEFESHYREYIQTCLDNSDGGTRGIPCLIGYEMWDRELNFYYKELYGKLDNSGKKALKQSQIAWLKERDLSIRFNSILLDRVYQEKQGTMYSLMRAGDADKMMVPIVKQRALYLKNASKLLTPVNESPVDTAELQQAHKDYGPVALQQKNNDDERN
jgi:uncharacterized protein YecT (DUF1311 family)